MTSLKAIWISAVVFAYLQSSLAVQIDAGTTNALQGNPIQIKISDLPFEKIKSVYFDNSKISFYKNSTSTMALYGIDLKYTVGTSTIKIIDTNNKIYTKQIFVEERKVPEKNFDIPEAMGGNTSAGQSYVSQNLAKENKILKNLYTNPKKLWTEAFAWPLTDIFVTDEYGYSRSTGNSLVTHRGLDLRAASGTPIYAMNRGVVRLSSKMVIYGNAVVIDHGQGVQTMYMHMSKIVAKSGTIINKGDLVGYAGNTGYSEGEHLHLTARLNTVSVDPGEFMKLLSK